ncbi:methyltransferase domain-containing protein [Arthrobacter sp. CJ23]|uniref:methyltransferase domain-containing protein n=1 Tax=Arthrobacter sp. CJ23 TaxID=2972479 RepID=UPI00215BB403|nr:methyltransferase domain-containing protein [Arthrobacter sp. CJ23]UVJ41277.1 methyltransferase domain-containing protein [Arthrobacter sp. CJ23]
MDLTTVAVDRSELEAKVKEVYRAVAQNPEGKYHFRMGRGLAEHLGYPHRLLDAVPEGAVRSFAGVGYFFDLADLKPGERVLDLGSGSGMDVFTAALEVGDGGQVVGLDMTEPQLEKAESLRKKAGMPQVTFVKGHIEDLPFADASFDCVISNGAINLSPDKAAVFREAARVLRPGGRLAIADIVTEKPLTPQIVCSTDLWAACIGGAAQADTYRETITGNGFSLEQARRNNYEFLSDSARAATVKYGVMSLSFLARTSNESTQTE